MKLGKELVGGILVILLLLFMLVGRGVVRWTASAVAGVFIAAIARSVYATRNIPIKKD